MTIADLPDYLAHFRARILQDALTEATAAYWRRRAATLEDARPHAGDFNGLATPHQLRQRHGRLTEAARACRRHAQLLDESKPAAIGAEVDQAIREAA